MGPPQPPTSLNEPYVAALDTGALAPVEAPMHLPLVPGQSLLWGIRPPDRPHVSYIFGTLHAVGIQTTLPDYGLDWRMEETQRLIVETVADWRGESLLDDALLPDGVKLFHVLRPGQYRRATWFFNRFAGLDRDVLDEYTPAHLALLAGTYMRHEGNYLDFVLRDYARVLRIRVEGLESINEQLAPLAGLDWREQGKLLDEVIRAGRRPAPETDALIRHYRQADLDSVALLLRNLPNPAYHPVVLENRNDLLLRRIEEALEPGPALIAVGVGNLPGETGLLARLREAGYEVWAILPEAASANR